MGGVSRVGAFATLFKINWGIGMMSMPYYISLLGAPGGVAFFALTMVLTYLSIDRLLRSADACAKRDLGAPLLQREGGPARADAETYPSICRAALGPRCEALSAFLIWLCSASACVAYATFVCNNATRFVGGPGWAWAVAYFAVVAPGVVAADDLGGMAACNYAGLGCGFAFSAIVVAKACARFGGSPGAMAAALARNAPALGDAARNLPVASGLAVFCNEGIVALAPSTRREMADRSAFRGVAAATLAAFGVTYMVVALCGAALYARVRQDLSLSFAVNALDASAAMAYVAQLLPTSLIVFFLAFEAHEGLWASRTGRGSRADLPRARVNAARVATVAAVAALGAAVPRFGDFLALSGSVTNATCIYVLPHLMFLAAVPDGSRADRIVSALNVAFGVASGLPGTVVSAAALFWPNSALAGS